MDITLVELILLFQSDEEARAHYIVDRIAHLDWSEYYG